jgi:hypothetical protein
MFGQGRESDTADAIHLAWMLLVARNEVLRPGGRVGPQLDKIKYLAKPPHSRHLAKKRRSRNQNDAVALFELRLGYTSVSAAWLKEPQR